MKKHPAFQFAILVMAALLGLPHAIATAREAASTAIIGDWEGAIDTGSGSLRIVVHIAQDKASA